jgi:hypothetical protein
MIGSWRETTTGPRYHRVTSRLDMTCVSDTKTSRISTVGVGRGASLLDFAIVQDCAADTFTLAHLL